MSRIKPILILSQDAGIAEGLRRGMPSGFCFNQTSGLDEALRMLRAEAHSAAVVDLDSGGARFDDGAWQAVSEISRLDRDLKVVALSDGVADAGLMALDAGAYDLFERPVDFKELCVVVRRAAGLCRVRRERRPAEVRANAPLLEMTGDSAPMQEVFRIIGKVAPVDVPVLILGESGTGKELAANAIHLMSARKNGPLTVINCGAIPENLLESELFGYEKGSFTGADSRRTGKIECADKGTLFLDEVGELSLKLQVKLLRFLQERTIEPIGGRNPVEVNARVIAATNRDLKSMIRKGSFREDLFYRLGVVILEMPPLRDRGEDICVMALKLLRKYSSEFDIPVSGYSRASIDSLKSYSWPGNIRELENKVKRAVALCRGKEITPEDLALGENESAEETGAGFIEAKERFKKRMIQETLLKNKGAVTRSATELGISRQYLSRLITRYNIRTR
ncbi:MAG: sigma-54-dependent Fis family transcriptional regulator [Deltaproteobacteria bacterium]|nr:sigma-54-dependent Fis family transcriptional regulator [Deltaproteobacteria bacterium]